MNRIAACVLVLPLALAACSSSGDSEPVTLTTTVKSPAPSGAEAPASPDEGKESSGEETQDGFDAAIANPGQWAAASSDEAFVPSGTYDYALVDLNGDGQDEMLIRTNGRDLTPVRVLTLDGGTIKPIEGYVIEGAASAGGYRGALYASKSGRGIYQVNGHSISPDWGHDLFGFDSGKLEKIETQQIGAAEMLPDYGEINWLPAGAGSQSGGAAPAPGASDQAQGSTITGTLEVVTAEEVVTQWMDLGRTPNGEPMDEKYLILRFDQPQSMTAMKAGQMDTQIVDHAWVEDYGGQWSSMAGQHVTVTYDPSQMGFPSDTSMPLGSLRMGGAILSITP